ncbi:MAG: TonB family protein [Acidobacteria bacterium]|nr:TonB family protein [Acidobacteriota bacterium]
MTPHAIDGHDLLRRYFVRSLGFHAGLLAFAVAYTLFANRLRETFGDPNTSGGGSVLVTPVAQIPIPSPPGRVNPVANDTESEAPKTEARPKPPAEIPEPDAVKIKGKKRPRRQTDIAASQQKFRDPEERINQLLSQDAPRAVSPMLGVQGSGGIGTGGNPFGQRFGWYGQLIRQRVAERWKTQDVDMRVRQAPPAIVTFVIQKDGTVRDVKVAQSSGNYQVDSSAQRAIIEAAPFPPLPQGFEKSTANVELWFELKR